jgi:site-specific DNA-cytosine methylase
MRHVDLFTGVGGFALALSGGISEAMLYCDIDPLSNEVLTKQQQAGRLPVAPIVRDVREVRLQDEIARAEGLGLVLDPPCQLLVASFPCVGMSSSGLRQGFKNVQTGLFYEMLRVVDEFQPPLLFLENVPGVLRLGMHEVAVQLNTKRGYELRWVVLPAFSVGAPHSRFRWFCLGVRPGTEWTWSDLHYRRHDFEFTQERPEPQRMVLQRGVRCRERSAFMGNALVPDCARMAFFYLVSGFRDLDFTAPELRLQQNRVGEGREPPPVEGAKGSHGGWPVCGWLSAAAESPLMTVVDGPTFSKPKLDLELVGGVPPQGPLPARIRTGLVGRFKFPLWATPRWSMTEPCRMLTGRSTHDLPTQLAFERATPPALRGGFVNPEWVERIMGFPQGWTA